MEIEEGGSLVLPEAVSDLLGSLDGIPAPVKRSFFKALGGLITGVADVPAAWLEGHAARIRSRTHGHQVVMSAAAKAAAAKATTDPALVDRALEYHANQLVRQQANREAVANHACDALRLSGSKNVEADASEGGAVPEVDEDWLLQFGDIASRKSKEDVQVILGRILAGEVMKPGSFAPITLEVLARLDQSSAQWFEHFCSLALVVPTQCPVVVLDKLGEDGKHSLSDDMFLHLQNYGLMSSVHQRSMNVDYYIDRIVTFGGQRMITSKCKRVVPEKFAMPPYLAEFSMAGAQLSEVIQPTFDREYALSLRDGLARWGVSLSFPDLTPGLE